MALNHLDIKKETNKLKQAAPVNDRILVQSQGGPLHIDQEAVRENSEAYNVINAEVLANRGLTDAEKNRIKAWKTQSYTFQEMAQKGEIDPEFAQSESYKYSDFYEEPGYFEKKSRRGAAEDSQSNIKKISKVLKKKDSLDNRLEIIRLSGHAECETLRAQGYSESSSAYIEARNRLLNRRIRILKEVPGAVDSSKYRKLYNNAVKELNKNKAKLQGDPDIKKRRIKDQENTEYVRKFIIENSENVSDDNREAAEKAVNKLDHRSYDTQMNLQGVGGRKEADFIEFYAWKRKRNEEGKEKLQNEQDQEKGASFGMINPFLLIAKVGTEGLFDQENVEKADSNTRFMDAYVNGRQDVFNEELEKNLDTYLNFKLPLKLSELKGNEDVAISCIPEMEKLSHIYYIFFADKFLDDEVFSRFYDHLGIEDKNEQKAFNSFIKSYLDPINSFIQSFVELAQVKYCIDFNGAMAGSNCGLYKVKTNLVNLETIMRYDERNELAEITSEHNDMLDNLNKINDDAMAKEYHIAFKEAYNLGIDMMQNNVQSVSIKDLAAQFKTLRGQ